MKKMLFVLLAFLTLSFSALAAVDLNTATEAELQSVNGIGPVKAKAIVDYRKSNGNFKSVDELEKVNGIGTKTVEKLRKDVTVGARSASTSGKKEVKAVGNEKAAASGKVAEIKDAKEAKPKK